MYKCKSKRKRKNARNKKIKWEKKDDYGRKVTIEYLKCELSGIGILCESTILEEDN